MSLPALGPASRGRRRITPRFATLAGALLVVGAFVACRKPPPSEVVYTGRTAGGATGGTPVATSPTPVPTAPPPEELPPPPPTPFTKSALLAAAADCALDRFREFAVRAGELRAAVIAFRDARSDASLVAAQASWRAAMASWQEAEVFGIGPSTDASKPGGKNLRDQLYAWPSVSRCKIEEALVGELYTRPEFAESLVNARGLAALEYLLFFMGTDNACSSFSLINSQGTWSALSAPELARRKASYAAAVAENVVLHATALAAAWDPAGGNFRGELATAGAGSKTFATDQAALNSLNEALFYVEQEVKDLKLGRPLGYIECEEATCPLAVESLYAHVSTANIRANLAGFRRIFQGCGVKGAGFGFDDLLRQVGAGDLADRMLAALIGAQAAADSLSPPLEEAIKSDPPKVAAVHAALRALTDPLKTEFVSVLNLELPKTAEGDND